MKPKHGDFTCGSQLIETFGVMLAAGHRPMLRDIDTLFPDGPRRNPKELAPRVFV